MNHPLADLAKQVTAYIQVGVFVAGFYISNAILKPFAGNDAAGLIVSWGVPVVVWLVVSSLVWGRPEFTISWYIEDKNFHPPYGVVDLRRPAPATGVNEISFSASLTIKDRSLGAMMRHHFALSHGYYVEVAFEPPGVVHIKDQNHGALPPGGSVRFDHLAIQLHVRASHNNEQVRLPGQLVDISLRSGKDKVTFDTSLRTRGGRRSRLLGKVSSNLKGFDVWS